MSKDITIQKDGVVKNYNNVKKIKTTDANRNRVNWVPLDETEQAVKTVNKNGTYKASSDGYYGYSKVVVSVGKGDGKSVGTKQDGRTYAIDTDEDGYFTETLLPDNIKIITQPDKLDYEDGDTIDLTGAVVKAYSLNDIWEGAGYSGGVIPLAELTTEPSTVTVEGQGTNLVNVSGSYHRKEITPTQEFLESEIPHPEWFNFPFVNSPMPFSFRDYNTTYYIDPILVYYTDAESDVDLYVFADEDGSRATFILCSDAPFTYCLELHTGGPGKNEAQPLTKYGKTMYFAGTEYNISLAHIYSETYYVNIRNGSDAYGNFNVYAKWIILGSKAKSYPDQKIAVNWNRPVDELTLTDNYMISVTKGSE